MYRHRLIQDGHMAENGYFGQIAPQKGPGDPLVDHTKLKKLVRKVKKNLS